MTGPFATRTFQLGFLTAGILHLTVGVSAWIWPSTLSQFLNLSDGTRIPALLFTGVGLHYLYAFWRIERAFPVIFVGLVVNFVGCWAAWQGALLDRSEAVLFASLYLGAIWWIPASLYVVRGTAMADWLERCAPTVCAVAHLLALATMAAWLRPGMLTEPVLLDRMAYIAGHLVYWQLGWITWMLSAASLVGFYGWWGSRLPQRACRVARIAVVCSALGVVCDWSGECLSAFVCPIFASDTATSAAAPEHFARLEHRATLLTAGAANLLYTVGGILLTLLTPDLPPIVRRMLWAVWFGGIGMTVSALLNSVGGMVVTTTLLFPPLIGATFWFALKWRRP